MIVMVVSSLEICKGQTEKPSARGAVPASECRQNCHGVEYIANHQQQGDEPALLEEGFDIIIIVGKSDAQIEAE